MENLKAEISESTKTPANLMTTTLHLESDFGSAWRIPRPSIHGSTSSSANTSQTGALSQYQRNLSLGPQIRDGKWSSSQSTSSSSNLTEGSQSMLISAYRLHKDPDTASIASSTHFTIVNGMRPEKSRKCCQAKYQLPILVVTMTFIIFLGILAGVLYIQIRARDLRHTQDN